MKQDIMSNIKMIEESLKHFFKTGELENINYGLTRAQLTKLLGKTNWEHYSSIRDKYPSIYKFGRLEFYFENQRKDAGLSGIMFQPIPAAASNGFLKCNYHMWTKNTDINKASEFLKANKIKFADKPYKYDNEARLLFTEGKVSIFFDCQQTPGYYLLHKAGRFIDN